MVKSRLVYIFLIGLLILFGIFILMFSGREEAIPATQVLDATNPPTIWVTTIVTQIVATVPSPTPTEIPTPTPFPTATLAWDPSSVGFYFPLVGCAASRLQVGEMAFVGYLDQPLRLLYTPQVFADPGKRDLVIGEYLQITGDPSCDRGWLVWEVRTISDSDTGFAAEGNGDVYWLFPADPSIPTPTRIRR